MTIYEKEWSVFKNNEYKRKVVIVVKGDYVGKKVIVLV